MRRAVLAGRATGVHKPAAATLVERTLLVRAAAAPKTVARQLVAQVAKLEAARRGQRTVALRMAVRERVECLVQALVVLARRKAVPIKIPLVPRVNQAGRARRLSCAATISVCAVATRATRAVR